jgi:hypothetical protein
MQLFSWPCQRMTGRSQTRSTIVGLNSIDVLLNDAKW